MKPALGWTMLSREEMRQVERSLANSEQDTRRHGELPCCYGTIKMRSSVVGKFGTRIPVGFCIRTPSVPRASIIWLPSPGVGT